MSKVDQQFETGSTSGLTTAYISYLYRYDELTGNLSWFGLGNGFMSCILTPTYNSFGLLENKTIDADISGAQSFYSSYTYAYKKENIYLSSLVSQLIVKAGKSASSNTTTTYNYTYDANGNITQITNASGSLLYRYTYDDLGQLIREDNALLASTFVYTYDDAGNILTKEEYSLTLTDALGAFKSSSDYTYSGGTWGDRLSFSYYSDGYGENIEYDAIGNPTLIGYYIDDEYDFHASTYLDWNGRELVSYETYDYNTRTNLIAYTYNADSIRTSKTVNGIKHEYILSGSQILAEMWTQNNIEYLLIYLYDDAGYPVALKYRTSNYANGVFDHFFFEKNVQGDIVAIYNSTGEKIGSYIYTAWGELEATTVSGNTTLENNIVNSLNPFRYRGYYYDVETGYYYLQSRYYNPNWSRFLSADAQLNSGVLGYNLYAYCYNNPVSLEDFNGKAPTEAVDENGDGVIDYYAYDYVYVEHFWFFGRIEFVYYGTVYIYVGVDRDYFDSDDFEAPEEFDRREDLLVIDLTNETVPNMLAYQSHIVNKKRREAIVDVLLQYDEDFNTPWERTDRNDLLSEWKNHKTYAWFSKRAQDVDFDNEEAYKGAWYFFRKAVRSFLGI